MPGFLQQSMKCRKEYKMSLLDQSWFSNISRPSRYMGREINAVMKDPAKTDVSIALAFPDVYEVGMSHQGLKILYRILNDVEWIAAERAFCPWIDLEKALRERRLPLRTMESHRPLDSFDVVGFSLQSELSFTNVLTMLDLSGIPFLSKERNDLSPLVIAGGPACFNPEPVAPLFDAIVIGDGEEIVLKLCHTLQEAKQRKVRSKGDILTELAKIRGVYIPQFFDVCYDRDGIFHHVEPKLSWYRGVKKAILPDLDRYPLPVAQVVPFAQLVHDRLGVEIARGCTRGCRFCQAGMIYRPVRERHPQKIIEYAEKGLKATGFEELSLLSLSSGDYSCIGPLLKTLMDRQSKNKVAVSFPSLRIDSLDPILIEQIKRVRKTGFTLAPEAGNDRLRKIINKGLTDADILKTARTVYDAGWKLIKLYFMVGLPGESEEDVKDIVRLSKEVLSVVKGGGAKANLNVSVAVFVPKAHTPFMWASQIPLREGQYRIGIVQKGFDRNRRVRVKWNQADMSWLEGVFSRGDRRVCKSLIKAWRLGARFDAWGECFRKDLWEEAFYQTDLKPEFYLHRPRSVKEIMPWDHIDSGINKAYLKKEYRKALEGKTTPDCRERCLECGVCDHKTIDPVLFRDWKVGFSVSEQSRHDVQVVRKYRITFTKTGYARHLSHLELVRLFIRAFKRAGLNLVYSKGYHPMPKVTFADALPVGTESLHETVDIQAYDRISPGSGKALMEKQLPSGIGIIAFEDVSREVRAPKLKKSHFLITLDGIGRDISNLGKFLEGDVYLITKKGSKGDRVVDARKIVETMRLISPSQMEMVLRQTNGPTLRPMEIIKNVFSLGDHEINEIKTLKTKQVMR